MVWMKLFSLLLVFVSCMVQMLLVMLMICLWKILVVCLILVCWVFVVLIFISISLCLIWVFFDRFISLIILISLLRFLVICLIILLCFMVVSVRCDRVGFLVGVMVRFLMLQLCWENRLIMWDNVFGLFFSSREMMCCMIRYVLFCLVICCVLCCYGFVLDRCVCWCLFGC